MDTPEASNRFSPLFFDEQQLAYKQSTYLEASYSDSSYQSSINLQFVSDVHLEYHPSTSNWWETEIIPAAETLILAGDIAPASHPMLPRFYQWCTDNFATIIHVPGNHEYWNYTNNKTTIEETETLLYDLATDYNIILAQEKIVLIDEMPIICCTLWCDIPDVLKYRNDFRRIKSFNPLRQRELNKKHKIFIEEALKLYSHPIVVTHHAPLIEGTQKAEYQGNVESKAYVNSLPKLVDCSKAWIFGHTHHVCEFRRLSGALVLSNPIGRQREKLGYSKSAVITVTRG